MSRHSCPLECRFSHQYKSANELLAFGSYKPFRVPLATVRLDGFGGKKRPRDGKGAIRGQWLGGPPFNRPLGIYCTSRWSLGCVARWRSLAGPAPVGAFSIHRRSKVFERSGLSSDEGCGRIHVGFSCRGASWIASCRKAGNQSFSLSRECLSESGRNDVTVHLCVIDGP